MNESTHSGAPGTWKRRRWALISLLPLLALGSTAAQPGATLSVPVLGVGMTEGSGTERFKARVDGASVPVVSIARVSNWRLVVIVDPALSTSTGLRAAADLLADRAEALTELGEVEILVVDTSVREVLPPTRDAESLRATLRSVPDLGRSGQITARRSALSPQAPPLARLEAGREEMQLMRWQREALADWLLLSEPGENPRALLLLQDGLDPDIEGYYKLPAGSLSGTPSAALDENILGPALAAAGWVAFPVTPAVPVDTRALPNRAELGARIAEATGGSRISTGDDADRAIAALRDAVVLDLSVDPQPSGPRRLEIDAEGTHISSPTWIRGAFLPGRSAALARSTLLGEESGGLYVSAALSWDGPDPDSVIIEVRADLDPRSSAPTSDWLSITLYLDQSDAPPLLIELPGARQTLAGIDRWVIQAALVLPDDPGELVAVVADASTGLWGAAIVDEDLEHLTRGGPGLLVEQFDLRPEQAAAKEESRETAISLLAPSGTDLKGRQRFQTLVTSPSILRVNFFLDDELVFEDEDAPFTARIDLGKPAARHTVRIEALNAVGDIIGTDSIRLNEPARSFEVSISGLKANAANRSLEVAAEVSHPADVSVERLEFYFNENQVETLDAPPWRTVIRHGELGLTDYVRVVAYLDDGRFLEDVRLLSAPGASEAVEVNLVQIYVVATNRDGEPVGDLTAEDFKIRLKGETQRIERFAYADEVPLLLGLVIDTSPSMWTLMPDTKRAAARFLTEIVSEQDQALVIDFDTRPRLAAPLTDDIATLLISLGSLVAEKRGTTALYDSVIFGALQLPAGQDRKALVLLTDGDDYKSRFGVTRAIRSAKQAGVPVYVVSLAGLHDARRQFPRTEIEALTQQTGGEAHYLGTMGELSQAYSQIARELRSQYLIAFPVSHQLSEEDLASIRVSVDRPGLELRTVVGGRSVN